MRRMYPTYILPTGAQIVSVPYTVLFPLAYFALSGALFCWLTLNIDNTWINKLKLNQVSAAAATMRLTTTLLFFFASLWFSLWVSRSDAPPAMSSLVGVLPRHGTIKTFLGFATAIAGLNLLITFVLHPSDVDWHIVNGSVLLDTALYTLGAPINALHEELIFRVLPAVAFLSLFAPLLARLHRSGNGTILVAAQTIFILADAVIFAAAHDDFGWNPMIARTTLGVMCSLTLWKTGRLSAAVGVHAGWNLAILLFMKMPSGGSTQFHWPVALPSIETIVETGLHLAPIIVLLAMVPTTRSSEPELVEPHDASPA